MAATDRLSRIASPDEEVREVVNDPVKNDPSDYDEENEQLDAEGAEQIKNIIHCAGNVCGVIRRDDLPPHEEQACDEDSIADTCDHFYVGSQPICNECYFSNPEAKYLHHLIETLSDEFSKVALGEKKTIEELRFAFSTKATFAKAKLIILGFREGPIDIILDHFFNYN